MCWSRLRHQHHAGRGHALAVLHPSRSPARRTRALPRSRFRNLQFATLRRRDRRLQARRTALSEAAQVNLVGREFLRSDVRACFAVDHRRKCPGPIRDNCARYSQTIAQETPAVFSDDRRDKVTTRRRLSFDLCPVCVATVGLTDWLSRALAPFAANHCAITGSGATTAAARRYSSSRAPCNRRSETRRASVCSQTTTGTPVSGHRRQHPDVGPIDERHGDIGPRNEESRDEALRGIIMS